MGAWVRGAACAAALLAVVFLAWAPARAGFEGPIDARGVRALLDGARGRVVVLNFWASWCAPCRKEIPDFIALRGEFAQADVLIVGVSLDFDPGAARAYAEEAGITYPVWAGADDVYDAFGVDAIPRTMIWDRQGNLAVDHVGILPPEVMRGEVGRLVGG